MTLPQEVIDAIDGCVKLYNSNHSEDIRSEKLKPVTADDYAVFIRNNGYAVVHKAHFAKLGKRKKNLLMQGCSYVSL